MWLAAATPQGWRLEPLAARSAGAPQPLPPLPPLLAHSALLMRHSPWP